MSRSKRNSAEDLPALSQQLGVPIPDDAKVLGVHRESGMDDMIQAKLELNPSAFARVAEKLPIRLDQLRPGPGRLGTDHGFWNPHATPDLRSGQVILPEMRGLNIGVAESADQVILFVLNHGT